MEFCPLGCNELKLPVQCVCARLNECVSETAAAAAACVSKRETERSRYLFSAKGEGRKANVAPAALSCAAAARARAQKARGLAAPRASNGLLCKLCLFILHTIYILLQRDHVTSGGADFLKYFSLSSGAAATWRTDKKAGTLQKNCSASDIVAM